MPEQARPIVAVGAVVWNADDEVLLVQRARAPRAGEWSIPGGKVGWGETLQAALLREVREETGLEIEIVSLIDVVDLVEREAKGDGPHHYALIDFTARYKSGQLRAGSDAREARWTPLAKLDGYKLWKETRRIIALSARQMGFAD